MDISKSSETIQTKIRQFTIRRRLGLFRDKAVVAFAFSSFICVALIWAARLYSQVQLPILLVSTVVIMGLALAYAWFSSRSGDLESAFLMDRELSLEDRLVSAHQLIQRGVEPTNFEAALIEDAAGRINGLEPAKLLQYRFKTLDSCALVGVALLSTIWLLPHAPAKPTTIDESDASIASAGQMLERSADEFERLTPVTTETGKLAREQAELGKALRYSRLGKSDALKRLSKLGERIRQRHNELKDTGADEIVSVSQKDLGSVLAKVQPAKQSAATKENPSNEIAGDAQGKTLEKAPGAQLKAEQNSKPVADGESGVQQKESSNSNSAQQKGVGSAEDQRKGKTSDLGQKSPARGDAKPKPDSSTIAKGDQGAAPDKHSTNGKNEPNAGGVDQEADDKSEDSTTNGAKDQERSGPASEIAKLAAKTSPAVSEQLLKKAAELKAGQLNEKDIKAIAQAAQALSKDLERLAQSKELRDSLEQLAKQISPEQLQQVAKELEKQEGLKQELEAAAKLLAQNQQAREMVVGLSEKFAEMRDQLRQQQPNSTPGGGAEGEKGKSAEGRSRKGDNAGVVAQSDANRQLEGKGREQDLKGKIGRGTSGEYLKSATVATAGATRTPYSAAYPQYRREAERYVRRTEVPSKLRTLVRNYFDNINPEHNH